MLANKYMQLALVQAQKASDHNEVPVGAILLLPDQSILQAHNNRDHSNNPLDHAEIRLLQEAAARLSNWRLKDCTLFVTLEPCPMCLGAMIQARLPALYYGASDPKRDSQSWVIGNSTLEWPTLKNIDSIRGNNHELSVTGGVLLEQCQKVLQDFYRQKRSI